MKYRITFIILVLFFLTAGGAAVLAATDDASEIEVLNQEIANRKERIKQLEDTIGAYKKTIDQKQTEAVSLKNQLSILDNRLAQIKSDIELTREKIKQAELEIEALNLTIKEKEKVIAKQKIVITRMVQTINVDGNKNYLEIMLTYDNFADFYNELKSLENVYADLGRSLRVLRLAKTELEAKKEQVNSRRKTYEDLKKQLDGKKQTLDEQAGLKQKILTETKSSELKYRTLLASLKQQYQVIEGEVRSYEAQIRKKLAEQDKLKAVSDVAFSCPLENRTITAVFHDPDYPFRRVFEHSGLDLRASQGTPVRAAFDGYVARARHCTSASCYSYVLIVHANNLSTVYGHLSSIAVADDQFVKRGQLVGASGGTPGTVGAGPFVTGPHLHFEVRLNGLPVDPLGYLVQ